MGAGGPTPTDNDAERSFYNATSQVSSSWILAGDLPETPLHVTSRHPTTPSLDSAVHLRGRVVTWGAARVVNPPRIDGKDGSPVRFRWRALDGTTAEAESDASSAVPTKAWTAVTTRVGPYR
jgi:hypothetical protein